MSSPPSLSRLEISDHPIPADASPLSSPTDSTPELPPTDTESENNDKAIRVNGNGTHPSSEDTPPTTPGIKPESSPTPATPASATPSMAGSLPRPAPPVNTASAPIIPNGVRAPPRPMPGAGPGRGGVPPVAMRGPMGMRGVGGNGPPQMQLRLPPSLQAKMEASAASRGPAPSPHQGPLGPNPNATSMSALLRSQALGGGLSTTGPASGPLSLAARRGGPGAMPRPSMAGGMSAPGGMGMNRPMGGPSGMGARRMGPPGGLTLSGMQGGGPKPSDNKFTDFGKIMDPSGSLRFSKRATLHRHGVDFEDGKSFKINMDEIEIVGELGKGNYGSVQQVYHRPSGNFMAMKEIRLELDESKLNGIIMELDILHRAVAPEIVEFYGAFTIESCVYYCMEYMDGGSLDTLTGGGSPAKPGQSEANEEDAELRVPEPVLRRITAGIVRGLGFLKDNLQIMHRDVKPTNVLMNKKGEVKLCDFGVSGQLEKSLAKTNIGCQSYMAPERIKGESQNQQSTYTVSSDVWSVGLSIVELAKGCYPYPPETFANVFLQLNAIVGGPSPTLPKGYSDDAQDFVAKCLLKNAAARPTYAQLLKHPFLLADEDAEVDMAGWVTQALARRAAKGVTPLPTVEA